MKVYSASFSRSTEHVLVLFLVPFFQVLYTSSFEERIILESLNSLKAQSCRYGLFLQQGTVCSCTLCCSTCLRTGRSTLCVVWFRLRTVMCCMYKYHCGSETNSRLLVDNSHGRLFRLIGLLSIETHTSNYLAQVTTFQLIHPVIDAGILCFAYRVCCSMST